MADLFALIGVAVVVFAATNVDDVLLLAAFFADPHLRPRTVVVGQFLGIGALVAVSAAAGLAALAVPAGYPALLGVVPLVLGVQKLIALRRHLNGGGEESGFTPRMDQGTCSQVMVVAGVTVANGGDNLGAYIPLFASAPAHIPIHAAVFTAMTALWCFVGFRLVQNRLVGAYARRYGPVALPFVLIALGLWILADARALLG